VGDANEPGAEGDAFSAVSQNILLVIVAGEARGASLALSSSPQVLGRGAEATLRVLDPRVSRAHADVSTTSDGVRFRCRSGATPVLIAGIETRDGVATPGQQVVVGETVFEVVVQPGPVGERTDLSTLLSGASSDVRGLSAIVALTETLDGARSRTEVLARLAEWAGRYARSTKVRVVEDRGPRDQGITRLAREPGTVIVVVPAHAEPGVAIEFELPDEGDAIGILRLLGVAGRLCGSTLVRLDALESAEQEKASLRRLAVGSARAFLGTSAAAAKVAKLIARLAASDVIGLLEGETGVGKTFVARLIHEGGERAQAPLQVVNCAAIPETLLESVLFGHERGAFTGATQARAGVFESAGRGTVLLDEIGELPVTSQSKLLHVLENKRFNRVGSTRSVPLTARVLAATNRDLEEMVRCKTFRSDLFFRLSVLRVSIPPLRERGDDLVVLAQHILADLGATTPRRVEAFTDGALEIIRRYPWPGNVRELRNVIEHALVLGDGTRIEVDDLPSAVRAGAAAAVPQQRGVAILPAPGPSGARSVDLPANLEWLEKRAIQAALEATAGNRKQAAAILGINRVTLYKKLKSEAGLRERGHDLL
jgi:DNA-binding NtrC family response regulator